VVEKSRDMGATWAAVGYAVWTMVFVPESSIGFGSQIERKVDRIGDLDSILEKVRQCIANLDPVWRPPHDMSFMKVVNLENGSMITGDVGLGIPRRPWGQRGAQASVWWRWASEFLLPIYF
jgi:hypothetical protein